MQTKTHYFPETKQLEGALGPSAFGTLHVRQLEPRIQGSMVSYAISFQGLSGDMLT